MRVMVIVKASEESEAGKMPSEAVLAEMGRYNEELVDAGIMVSGDGLHPSSRGVRVSFEGDQRTVTDGPFAETRELVGGFWIWQVKDLAEAVEWAKRAPITAFDSSSLELRPIIEAEDFGEAYTPEIRAQEDRLRARLEAR